MNLAQRVILVMGCVGAGLVWLVSAAYRIQPDGPRLESNWTRRWEAPLGRSVSVPLTTLRPISINLRALGLYFASRTNPATAFQA